MDGSIVKLGAMGCGVNSVVPRAISTMETSDEWAGGVLSRESEEVDPLESDRDRRKSLGGDFCAFEDALPLGRGPSYMHMPPLPLLTHVVQGCLASHF